MNAKSNQRRADVIRELLEQMIVSGAFADGERLDEVRLAERFAVSRTPLREAFQALASSGLVELVPHRGAFARVPGLEEMVEMFEVMAEMEAVCGRLAARRATPARLAELRAALEACERAGQAGDLALYYRENERFHRLIYAASGNRFLAAETERLLRRVRPFRRLQLQVNGRLGASRGEHRRILEALEAGDGAATEAALRAHVSVQGDLFNDLVITYRRLRGGERGGEDMASLTGDAG